MRFDNSLWIRRLAGAGFIFCITGLAFGPEQSNFIQIIGWYVPLFVLYTWILLSKETENALPFWLLIAALARISLFFAFPGLSDDVYRFLWDGYLWNAGENPFQMTPAAWLQVDNRPLGLDPELFRNLNSSNYFTIYPPVAQFSFWLGVALFPGNWYAATLVMKIPLIAAEMGTIWLLPVLLKRLQLPAGRALIYALNPLVILEVSGNLHHEGLMVFFLLLTVWLLIQKYWVSGAGSLALAVASKLLPLMLFPLLVRRLGWKRSAWFFPLVGLFLFLLFAPLYDPTFVSGFSSSLDLYFRKFEFNANLYYLFRWIGYQRVGYNQIAELGPRLAMLTVIGILAYAALERRPDWSTLFSAFLFAITLYLFNTTTIHPWYLALPLAFCGFTRFRFPVVWSALVVLTYINYSYPDYRENLWMVGLEYTVVWGWLIWELTVVSSEKTV